MASGKPETYRQMLPYAQGPDPSWVASLTRPWPYYDLIFTDRRLLALHLPRVPFLDVVATFRGFAEIEHRQLAYRQIIHAQGADALLGSDLRNLALPYTTITRAAFDGSVGAVWKPTLHVSAPGLDIVFYWTVAYLARTRIFARWAKDALSEALEGKVTFDHMEL